MSQAVAVICVLSLLYSAATDFLSQWFEARRRLADPVPGYDTPADSQSVAGDSEPTTHNKLSDDWLRLVHKATSSRTRPNWRRSRACRYPN